MKSNELTPEKRLICAVIYEAIRDCRADCKEIREDARNWLLDIRLRPHSLRWYLKLLEVDIDKARVRILQAIAGNEIGKNQSIGKLLRGAS